VLSARLAGDAASGERSQGLLNFVCMRV